MVKYSYLYILSRLPFIVETFSLSKDLLILTVTLIACFHVPPSAIYLVSCLVTHRHPLIHFSWVRGEEEKTDINIQTAHRCSKPWGLHSNVNIKLTSCSQALHYQPGPLVVLGNSELQPNGNLNRRVCMYVCIYLFKRFNFNFWFEVFIYFICFLFKCINFKCLFVLFIFCFIYVLICLFKMFI